jgi:hypothetical protein
MSDERELRALLRTAAELPDDVLPPVQRLISLGRRRRTLRAGFRALTVGVIAAVAVATPQIIGAIGTGKPPVVSGQVRPGGSPARHPKTGPGTAQPRPTAPPLAGLRWSALPASPLVPRQPDVFAWAGRDVLEIGGAVKGKPSKTGAMFDLASRTWRRMAPVPSDVNVAFSTSTWTGRQLFVTDGRFPRCESYPPGPPPSVCLPHAGLFDPATNHWSTTPLPRPMYALPSMVSTWTGRDVILAGVTSGNPRLEVAAYDPAADRWTMITPALPARHSPQYATVVATAARVIMWVLWSHVQLGPHPVTHSGVDVLALSRDGRWRDVTDGWPQHQTISTPAFTGSEILVPTSATPCFTLACKTSRIYPGAFADPVTLHRTLIPFSPIDALQPPYIWTGNAIIEMNQQWNSTSVSGHRILRDEAVGFDPATGRWRQLPAPPGRPFAATTPIWAGTEMLFLSIRGALFALHS